MQFYTVSDNVLGFLRPLDSRTINLRFGVNLMLGCPKRIYGSKTTERFMVPCPPGQGEREKKRRGVGLR